MKGQITAFVVIGIIIVIIAAMILVFTGQQPRLDETATQPARSLVESCIDTSLEELIRVAGKQGGHLSPTMRVNPLAHESEAVLVQPQIIPYWSHIVSCPDGLCEKSEQPPLCDDCPVRYESNFPSIQAQLEEALPGTVQECIGNFSDLPQFSIFYAGTPHADIIITEAGVLADLDMPIAITDLASGQQRTITEFTGAADVNLLRVYTLAHELAQTERAAMFLEELTLHLVSVYSGVDEPLPPMRQVSLLGQKQYWTRSSVEDLLMYEVLPWIGFVQVPNAPEGFTPIMPPDNLTLQEQRLYAGVLYALNVPMGDTIYEGTKVTFAYPYTRPYLSINGGQEFLRPRSADIGGFMQQLTGLAMNDYRFSYDISYPVVVSVTDTEAFAGAGFTLEYALEVNIRDNEPVNTNTSVSSFRLTLDQVDISNPTQRVNNQIVITVDDRYSQQPLDGARITYRCGDDQFIGETINGVLETQLPYCRYGGVVLVSAAGYAGTGVAYDNYEEGIVQQLDFELWPFANITATAQKRNETHIASLRSPSQQLLFQESIPLNNSDLALITLERVNETPYDGDVPPVSFFSLSQDPQVVGDLNEEQLLEQELVLENEIRSPVTVPAVPREDLLLVPGTYIVDATLVRTSPFTIPQETREFCLVDVGICFNKRTITLNETNVSSWITGGARTEFDITPGMLYNADNVTFFLLEQQIPNNWTALEEYTLPDEFLQGHPLLQLPVLR